MDYGDGTSWYCEEKCSKAEVEVFEPTIFDPATGQWSEKGTLATMLRPRLYHSVAVLLPDCTASAGWLTWQGAGQLGNSTHSHVAARGAVYRMRPQPHELWLRQSVLCIDACHAAPINMSYRVLLQVMMAGSDVTNDKTAEIFSPPYLNKGPQPVIVEAPTVVTAGTEVTVPYMSPDPVQRAILIRNAAVTHSMAFGEAQPLISPPIALCP